MNGSRGWTLALLIAATGCNDRPSRNQFLPIPSALTSGGHLVVDGPASIEPGASARFTATLIEGSARRDVTRDAQWSARGSGIAITEPGVATAQDLGFARIFVSYGAAYTRVNLAAKPAGTFVVMGRVAPLIAGAPGRVEVIDGPAAGRSAIADSSGEYFLVGVAGGLRVRASMLGHAPVERALAVNGDVEADFSLTTVPSPDVVGRWRLLVRADPECRPAPAEASATIDITRSMTPTSSFHYRLGLPALPQQEPMRATIIGTTFSAELDLGDEYWGRVAVPLGESAEILGSALGEVGPTRITGTIEGAFTDKASSAVCDGTHGFELRREGT
jgi:hypothetical protein